MSTIKFEKQKRFWRFCEKTQKRGGRTLPTKPSLRHRRPPGERGGRTENGRSDAGWRIMSSVNGFWTGGKAMLRDLPKFSKNEKNPCGTKENPVLKKLWIMWITLGKQKLSKNLCQWKIGAGKDEKEKKISESHDFSGSMSRKIRRFFRRILPFFDSCPQKPPRRLPVGFAGKLVKLQIVLRTRPPLRRSAWKIFLEKRFTPGKISAILHKHAREVRALYLRP